MLCVLGGWGTPMAAQKVGTLADIRGSVEILHPGDRDFRAAKLYEDVLEKDKIRTGPGARAKVLYDDDSLTTLGENTAIDIQEYRLGADKKRTNSLIGLLQGKLRFIVTKYLVKDKPNFSVQTPTAVMGVRGSDSIALYDGQCTRGFQLSGQVQMSCSDSLEPRTMHLNAAEWGLSCRQGPCQGPNPIGADQLQELLGYFAAAPGGQDHLGKELTQEVIDLTLPERENRRLQQPGGSQGGSFFPSPRRGNAQSPKKR
jgi:hypothetical protein